MACPDVLVNTYVLQNSESKVVKALKYLIIAHAMLGIDRTSLCTDIKCYVKIFARSASVLLATAMITLTYVNINLQEKILKKLTNFSILTTIGFLGFISYKSLDKVKKFSYKINEVSSLFDTKLVNAYFRKLRNTSFFVLATVIILFVGTFFVHFNSDLIRASSAHLLVVNLCFISCLTEGWTVALYIYSIKYFLNAIKAATLSLGKETIFFIPSSEDYLYAQMRKLNLMFSKVVVLSRLHMDAFCSSIETLFVIFVINPTMLAFVLVLNAVDSKERVFSMHEVISIIAVLIDIIVVLGPACHIQSNITEEASSIKRNLLLLRCRHSLNKRERSSLSDFNRLISEHDFTVRIRSIMNFDRVLPFKIFANLASCCVLLLQFHKLYVA